MTAFTFSSAQSYRNPTIFPRPYLKKEDSLREKKKPNLQAHSIQNAPDTAQLKAEQRKARGCVWSEVWETWANRRTARS